MKIAVVFSSSLLLLPLSLVFLWSWLPLLFPSLSSASPADPTRTGYFLTLGLALKISVAGKSWRCLSSRGWGDARASCYSRARRKPCSQEGVSLFMGCAYRSAHRSGLGWGVLSWPISLGEVWARTRGPTVTLLVDLEGQDDGGPTWQRLEVGGS